MLIRFLIVQYFPLYVISGMVLTANTGSVPKSVSGRNSKKGPAKILTGPNKFVILGDKT